jgi:hypothetical protein
LIVLFIAIRHYPFCNISNHCLPAATRIVIEASDNAITSGSLSAGRQVCLEILPFYNSFQKNNSSVKFLIIRPDGDF